LRGRVLTEGFFETGEEEGKTEGFFVGYARVGEMVREVCGSDFGDETGVVGWMLEHVVDERGDCGAGAVETGGCEGDDFGAEVVFGVLIFVWTWTGFQTTERLLVLACRRVLEG
jgi:hypothetical protein